MLRTCRNKMYVSTREVLTGKVYLYLLQVGWSGHYGSVDPQKCRSGEVYWWSYDRSDDHGRQRNDGFRCFTFSTSGSVLVYVSRQIWERRSEPVGVQNWSISSNIVPVLLEFAEMVVTSSKISSASTFLRFGIKDITGYLEPQKRRCRIRFSWSYDGSNHHCRLRHSGFVVFLFSTSGAVVVYAARQIWEWRFELVGGQNYLMNYRRTTTLDMFHYHFYDSPLNLFGKWGQL